MTDTIASFMTDDHHRCDHLLANCERAIGGGDWDSIAEQTASFAQALLGHFDREEQVLFPELVAVSPWATGPSSVMTMEHEQMRALVQELDEMVQARDAAACLGLLETLHMVSQQHNAKEEGILYPMAVEQLDEQTADLLNRLSTD
ncbi:hemerythrin domain-containing protein [Thiohalocapsa marina]|uniref:Hemerythrin domain-containing protein n=1 Tax=Thiohalocapsa marina TaxID=424902 RepID=A0A5M8FVF7_9GAMM|nr:hemerythrin domain-containing protein [Thiohalocapsa marina]KAA6187808.1 hemerythrin domain-containing protein [Thiohalocapsa marina]